MVIGRLEKILVLQRQNGGSIRSRGYLSRSLPPPQPVARFKVFHCPWAADPRVYNIVLGTFRIFNCPLWPELEVDGTTALTDLSLTTVARAPMSRFESQLE